MKSPRIYHLTRKELFLAEKASKNENEHIIDLSIYEFLVKRGYKKSYVNSIMRTRNTWKDNKMHYDRIKK